MEALIAELETATEGGWRLDALIYAEIEAYRHSDSVFTDERGVVWVADVYDENHEPASHHPATEGPRFSRSLDAALTLVPAGMLWQVGSAEGEATVIWEGAPSYFTESSTGESWASDGDTINPALALCIAALKARQAMEAAPPPAVASSGGG